MTSHELARWLLDNPDTRVLLDQRDGDAEVLAEPVYIMDSTDGWTVAAILLGF